MIRAIVDVQSRGIRCVKFIYRNLLRGTLPDVTRRNGTAEDGEIRLNLDAVRRFRAPCNERKHRVSHFQFQLHCTRVARGEQSLALGRLLSRNPFLFLRLF